MKRSPMEHLSPTIKRLFCGLVLAFATTVVFAQAPPGRPHPDATPDPSTLSESQIKGVTVPAVLDRLAAAYRAGGDDQRLIWTMQRLTALLPNSGDAKLALATLYAAQDEKSKTYDLLLHMQQQGFGYDIAHDKRFDKVADTKVWAYVVANLKANLDPFGKGKVAFTLPKGDTLLESLAYDPKRKQFLVGSVRNGTIQRIGKDGMLERFIAPDAANGLWSVYAMAADPERDLLYVASTSSVFFKGFKQDDYGKAGLFEFNLSTGKLVDKMLLPADGKAHTLSSVTVGKTGEAFVADGVRNEIYRVDGGTLKLLVANPRLTSVRGLAASDDGRFLYFADYTLGIFGVDLKRGTGFDLNYDPAALVLGGIDGLYWYRSNLVAIENGMSPPRIMRLRLSDNGHDITKVMPLDAANPNFALPTYGAIAGDSLYFIANSQKNRYDRYGDPKDVSKLQPVRVFKSDLRFAWNKSGIGTAVKAIPVATPAQREKMLNEKPGARPAASKDGNGNSGH
ncbi:MAG: hypothetical protein WB784_07130 [Rhodanobacteraceae bacterium]